MKVSDVGRRERSIVAQKAQEYESVGVQVCERKMSVRGRGQREERQLMKGPLPRIVQGTTGTKDSRTGWTKEGRGRFPILPFVC